MTNRPNDIFRDRSLASDQLAAMRRENRRLTAILGKVNAALAEIERIADERTILDWGERLVGASSDTCLEECGTLARKAREQ